MVVVRGRFNKIVIVMKVYVVRNFFNIVFKVVSGSVKSSLIVFVCFFFD